MNVGCLDGMDKNIIVIGGTSGIGNSIVQAVHSTDNLYVTGRSSKNLEGLNVKQFQLLDVLTATDFSWLPESIDGLVYCPGSINLKPFARLRAEDLLLDYQVNVIGAFNVIQQALPGLKKSGNGSIVLFSSVAAQRGMAFHSSISPAKAGVEALARSCAAEFASARIRVNVISPSLTDTPLAKALLNTPEKLHAAENRHPLKRIGSPIEAAALVRFLLSADSGFITGQTFAMDGGMSTLS